MSKSEDVAYAEPDNGDALSCVIQKILLAPTTVTMLQRHELFRTRFTIKGKICNIIMDSGSNENMVSKKLV